jgi:hypothetical protein
MTFRINDRVTCTEDIYRGRIGTVRLTLPAQVINGFTSPESCAVEFDDKIHPFKVIIHATNLKPERLVERRIIPPPKSSHHHVIDPPYYRAHEHDYDEDVYHDPRHHRHHSHHGSIYHDDYDVYHDPRPDSDQDSEQDYAGVAHSNSPKSIKVGNTVFVDGRKASISSRAGNGRYRVKFLDTQEYEQNVELNRIKLTGDMNVSSAKKPTYLSHSSIAPGVGKGVLYGSQPGKIVGISGDYYIIESDIDGAQEYVRKEERDLSFF